MIENHSDQQEHTENIPIGKNKLLSDQLMDDDQTVKPQQNHIDMNPLENNKPSANVDVVVTDMSDRQPSPILHTEVNFLQTERAADKDIDFSDAEDKFELLKVPQFKGDHTAQNKPVENKLISLQNKISFVEQLTRDVVIKQESFESIPEEPEPDQKKGFPFQETKRKANCCSIFTYWYVNTLVDSVEYNNGKMDSLFIEDMNNDPKRDQKLLDKFNQRLKENLECWQRKNPNNSQADNNQWYSFTKRAIRSTVGMHFYQVAFLAFVAEICTLYAIYMIKYIAEYLIAEDNCLYEAAILVATFSISLIVSALLRNFYIYYGYTMSLETRKVLISALYDKINKLSMRSLTETNQGRFITVLSQQIFALERSLAMAPFGLSTPFINLACYGFIWQIVGWEYTIAMLLLWMLTMLIQMWIARKQVLIQQTESRRNDERLKLVNDMITGIHTIKAYAWEKHYQKKVKDQRHRQEKSVFCLNLIGSLSFNIFQNIGLIGILCIFMPKWFMAEELSVSDSFTLLAMVYYLFFCVNSLAYSSISTMSQASAIIQKLSLILSKEEYKLKHREEIVKGRPAVEIKSGDYAWGFSRMTKVDNLSISVQHSHLRLKNSEASCLKNIQVELMPEDLLIVVGKSGSGKTSFLQSIMDETVKKSGTHEVNGKIAYVEQNPFIFEGTVLDNICFGLVYAECRFRKAVSAAQLDGDIEQLPQRFKTTIGSRGFKINKSMRARISLARAIYQNADIYLIDEMLYHVENIYADAIFKKTIQGVLSNKCVILVTHQLEFLQKVKKIMVLRDGKQIMLGQLDELVQQGFDFDEILQQYRTTTHKASIYKEEMKAQEQVKQKKQLRLLRQFTSQVSERDYVAAVNNGSGNQKLSDQEDEDEEGSQLRKQLRQRERNIKLLRKQVLALAQEELSKHMKQESRSNQTISTNFLPNDRSKARNKNEMIIAEKKDEQEIKWKDVKDFFSFSYGTGGMICLFFVCLITAITQLLPSLWLIWWLDNNAAEQCQKYYPIVFVILVSIFLILTIVRSLALFKILIKSATNMHDAVTWSVLRANIKFFDQNPIGRILSRFSKDLVVFDLVVPIISIIMIQGFFRAGTAIVIICIVNPLMIIVTVFAAILVFVTLRRGKPVMIETQKHDTMARAPINDNISSLFSSVISLRACGQTDFFRQEFLNNLSFATNATFCYVIANRWISIRLDILCCVFISFVCFFMMVMKNEYEASWLIMSLQVSIEIMFLFSISFRMYAEIQNHIESSQRMVEYTYLEEEDQLQRPGDVELERRMWPTAGKIEFEEATLRYKDENEPSINNVSFKAQAGMLIGIIGRSGSGKSSILHSLFRLIELENGRTLIDGIDIKSVGLHTLRKQIAFIPQSPFLLQGTIRENLDPQEECTDSQIDAILREVKMYEKVYSLPQNLNTAISESNNLFSSGQKQLLCLARAIIRKTRVLVLDEATNKIDPETDSLIQQTLRERFKNCTVFVVAHRLATIIDADRVLVLKEGLVAEYSHPYNLLVEQEGDKTITNIQGQFARMIIATGIENAHTLFEIAEKSYKKDNKFYEPLKNSLSVTDNRTGKTYELQIQNNAILASQLLEIKNVSGNVTRSYDPAYINTVNCISRISYIDGEKGILEYRGFPIDQLARRSRFTETAFLLIYGQLPSKNQILAFETKIRINYIIDEKLRGFIETYRQEHLSQSHPMGMLQTLISCLSSCHPESNPAYYAGQFSYKCQDERDTHIHRILGQAPSIAAACLRIYSGMDIIQPDINLGYAENFLHMTLGPDNPLVKNSKIIHALETLFIVHAEHELNCSTAAMRHMASAMADVYVSLSGAITALYGTRHGGANEAVFRMLEEIGTVENVANYVQLIKRKDRCLNGFGHRSYTNNDPRAVIVKQLAYEIFDITGKDELINVAEELERIVMTDEFFISRKLYPNVDFYSGMIFKSLGFPTEFFTVLYALPKFTGWMAHWNEFIDDPENRIVRPRQIYLGERSRNYVAIHDRLEEELAPYEVKDNAFQLQINLPTIYSQNTSSLSITMTDASIDADRQLFMISKRTSDNKLNGIFVQEGGREVVNQPTKSKFAENVDNQINDGSDEQSISQDDCNSNQQYMMNVNAVADPDPFQLINESAASFDNSMQSETPSKKQAYVTARKPVMSQKNLRSQSQEADSLRDGSFMKDKDLKVGIENSSPVNCSPDFIQNVDISDHLDEAPVSKARTLNNLLSVNTMQKNALSKMRSDQNRNVINGEKSSILHLPIGAIENSAASIGQINQN